MCITAYSYVAQFYVGIGANDRESDTTTRRDMSGVVAWVRVRPWYPLA